MEKITNKQIIENVKTMTAVQLKELVELIEKTFGVTAAVATAPVVAAQEVATTPSTVSLILKEVGEKKVDVIKAVKAIVGTISLMDAKKIVDEVAKGPQNVLKDIDAAKAAEHEAVLKVAGATVEVK